MLRAWLHGTHVGDLRLYSGSRWEFRFDEGYVARPRRPVLGRWFEDQNMRELSYSATQSYLPPFFQNYLPEAGSWLREQLASRAGIDPSRNGPLLAALGEDLPGAIVVREVSDLDDGGDELPAVDRPVPREDELRFSLAGMQPKYSVAKEGSKYTLPVTGRGGRWIAKLPDPQHAGVPEHEAGMLTLARKVGIEVPDHECVPWRDIGNVPPSIRFAEPMALIVRRYDRTDDGARIHQEDFAQVLDRRPGNKYNDGEQNGLDATFRGIGKVIAGVCGHDDFIEYVRRLTFMVLIGDHDSHLKNWSLYYPDPLRARLAPAYDLLSTIAYMPDQPKLALGFFKRRRFDEVLRGDFERLAEKAHVDVGRALATVDETVARFHEAWHDDAAHLPLSAEQRSRLTHHLGTLPLARSA